MTYNLSYEGLDANQEEFLEAIEKAVSKLSFTGEAVPLEYHPSDLDTKSNLDIDTLIRDLDEKSDLQFSTAFNIKRSAITAEMARVLPCDYNQQVTFAHSLNNAFDSFLSVLKLSDIKSSEQVKSAIGALQERVITNFIRTAKKLNFLPAGYLESEKNPQIQLINSFHRAANLVEKLIIEADEDNNLEGATQQEKRDLAIDITDRAMEEIICDQSLRKDFTNIITSVVQPQIFILSDSDNPQEIQDEIARGKETMLSTLFIFALDRDLLDAESRTHPYAQPYTEKFEV